MNYPLRDECVTAVYFLLLPWNEELVNFLFDLIFWLHDSIELIAVSPGIISWYVLFKQPYSVRIIRVGSLSNKSLPSSGFLSVKKS